MDTNKIERNGEVWLVIPAAAKRLGVTNGRIYHLTSDKRLRTVLGTDGLHYVHLGDLEKYERYRKQLRELRRTGRPLAAAAS